MTLGSFAVFFFFSPQNEVRVDVFALVRSFHRKTSCPLSHQEPVWAGLGSPAGHSTCKIHEAASASEALVQPSWGWEWPRHLPDHLISTASKRFPSLWSQARQMNSLLPQTHVSTKRFAPQSQEHGTLTFHFDGFHGNPKIKLCSYLLQHYIICQTLWCFSTNVFVLGWLVGFFFFLSQYHQPDLCWSV